MNRSIYVVDYATSFDKYCRDLYNLNTSFTISSKIPGSPYLQDTPWYDFYFRTFNLLDNDPSELFCQKFEELNPDNNGFHYKIFPDIRVTMPVGFELVIESIMPGIKVKHVMCRKHPGKYYRWEDEIIIQDRTGWEQDTRLVGSPDYYNMVSIDQIEFDTDPISKVCTDEGVMLTYNYRPETDFLKITFNDLYKTRDSLHCDHPDLSPMWNTDTQYRELNIIRNATLFNYMF